ncbi:LPXTG-motif cell wall-anchored protein [Amycolatopsis sulphurea]|uniref:LPXTG-motif cell wall-anchored protein n=1 Tax=Amycolatopsis sulphurea TaxID=76022 RepID=A0A2A9F922_9PSEU|nr:hypothetical protein [Amycolatopsis sulphurea]PFG47010.1 LPXTG-motif cell wall-anchored protein [Amycolatopsis sulphurea]
MRKRGAALALLSLLAAAGTMFGVAQAAVPAATLGTLTVEDIAKKGTDVNAPHYTTSAGCPSDADSYNLFIYGPGVFEPGLIGTTTTDVGIAHDAGFPIFQGLSFKDIAVDHQGTVQPGRYDIVAHCVDGFSQEVKGTFTMPLWFTDATHYTVTDPASPPTTTTTTTSSSGKTSTTTPTEPPTSDPETTTSTTESDTSTDPGGVAPTDTTPPGSGGDTPSNPGDKKLASTGVPAGLLTLAGLGLLGAGVLAVLVTRRRREVARSAWPE